MVCSIRKQIFLIDIVLEAEESKNQCLNLKPWFTVTILSSEKLWRATVCPAPYTELLLEGRQPSPAQRFRALVLFSSWVCLLKRVCPWSGSQCLL